MRPVVFSNTIGWVHPAGGSRGVVVAGAHGFDDLCSRRFLTMMARRIAGAGLPVLQFDYPGCGDAAGDHEEPGRVAAWTKAIGTAIERLKEETGVSDVLVIGFRLGALLAPAAVAGRDDVAGVALLAPPASGKAYVRELTGLSRMIDGTLRPPEGDAAAVPFDGIRAAGFAMTAETVADLRGLDWPAALQKSGVRDVLLMPAAPSPAAAGAADRLARAGACVVAQPFAGYNTLMCDPTANEIPLATLAMVVAWARERAGRGRLDELAVAVPDSLAGPHWEERPVVIRDGPEICGVLCLPAGGGDPEEVTLFLNAGAVPHVGWARGTVEMARALAARGGASLRIDLPGLGQSEAPPEKRLFLYDMRTRADVARVVDWLERAGFRRVCATGTCSGAFQAFHAARSDPRIDRLAMVNPLCFAWNSSYALDMGVWKAYESSRAARRKADGGEADELPGDAPPRGGMGGAPGGIMAAVRGAVSFGGRRSVRRTLELIKSGLAGLSPARLAGGRPVERWMSDLVARGTRVLMVTSEGDLSHEEIARHFGPGGERLARLPAVTMRELPAADHTLTPPHARRLMAEHLAAFTRPEPAPVAAGASAPVRPAEKLLPVATRA